MSLQMCSRPLSYGIEPGLRREVGVGQGPGNSFPLFYHVPESNLKNSLFAPVAFHLVMKIYLSVVRGWTIFYLIVR